MDLRGEFRQIYIDPPFLSGTIYTKKTRVDGDAESSAIVSDIETYNDKWASIDEYLEFMRPRLTVMKDLLTENGSLWVHLDWHVSHYVKVLLDGIFGYENFVNEIVWTRTNSPKTQSKGFGAQHDVILLYALDSEKFQTNSVYRKHDERSKRPYSYKDDRGRFRLIEIEAQGIQRSENRKQFEWRGRTAPYLYRKETLEKWWREDLIYRSRNGRYTKKQYLDDTLGIPVSDLWFDIAPVQGKSKEYTGFLTQKPVALLERIIQSASESGDLVGDFFAGSGTTAIAAASLRRRWILCDLSASAIEVAKERIEKLEMTGKFLTITPR
ncbi:MAG: site-specific DNA-methyltransferase [Candidatus Thorarchaeota archaeon]|nr:site-specific DNA-methyltransferase [Candidatus Thorarchaeota archaeon]